MNLSDEELVDQICTTNNSVLFGLLYDRYSERVYNKCISFSKNPTEAEDLTQDVFLKVFIKLKTFKGKSRFTTWIYAMTYNHCVNYVNRDKERKIENKSVPIKDYDNLNIEVGNESLFKLKTDKLEKALQVIPPEDKMILLLKYQDDASIKDIADTLEIGESAVKMRVKRAKARVIKMCNKTL